MARQREQMDEGAIQAERRRRWKAKQEVAEARTLPQLEEIAKARGYDQGWAHHVFEARMRYKRRMER